MKLSITQLSPVPAVLLSIISVQGGAAIAKGLFPILGAGGAASVRIGFFALILAGAVRPNLGKLNAGQWKVIIPYGLILGIMNLLFYCALARVPMGLAVTLEFIGPLVLALAGSRRALDILWVVLAGAGIALIVPWSGKGLDLIGLFFALAAGGCWAIYILLSQRAGAIVPGQLAVTVGMMVAAIPVLPFGLAWGSKGSEIFMPLSPEHMLYTKVGHYPPPRDTRFSIEQTKTLRLLMAKHTHRYVYADHADHEIVKYLPRAVSAEKFKFEDDQWDRWHSEQTESEDYFFGNI